MADRVLFVSWEVPNPGAEASAIESIQQSFEFYTRWQQDGRIEGFDVVALEPNNVVGGFTVVRGNAEQIAALKEDEEFTSIIMRGLLVCRNVNFAHGYINEGLDKMMGLYREAIASYREASASR